MKSEWLLNRGEKGSSVPHVITVTLIDLDIGGSLRVVLKFQTARAGLNLLGFTLKKNPNTKVQLKKCMNRPNHCIPLHRYHKAKSGTREQKKKAEREQTRGRQTRVRTT